MAGIKIVNLPSLGRDLASTDLFELSLAGGTGSRKITGQEIMNASKLSVGNTPIVNGAVGQLLFQGAGNVLGESANLTYDNTNLIFTLGSTATRILTFRPQDTTGAYGNSSSIRGGNGLGRLDFYSTSNITELKDNIIILTSTGGPIFQLGQTDISFNVASSTRLKIAKTTGNVLINTTTDSGYTFDVNGTARVKGTGTTSATSAFTVQNSAGLEFFRVQDDGVLFVRGAGAIRTGTAGSTYYLDLGNIVVRNGNALADSTISIGKSGTADASSICDLVSITKGFLPPRGTNTQMLAIATPAAGLMFIDNTTATNNILNLYNGTGWGSVLTSNPTVTAAAALGRGFNFTPALTAAANSDVLVGLDINPTFTNGAFTSVQNIGLRVSSNINTSGQYTNVNTNNFTTAPIALRTIGADISGISIYKASFGHTNSIQFLSNDLNNRFSIGQGYIGVSSSIDFIVGRYTSSAWSNALTIFNATGNVSINSATDAGYKLDVNGTARFSGQVNVTTNTTIGTDGTITNTYLRNAFSACFGAVAYAPASVVLECRSTTQGFLPPRMTQTQRNAIASPAIGLEIYQTDATEGKYIYKSSGWTYIG